MCTLSVADVARILEHARDAALPGREAAVCNAIWCELGRVLRSPATGPGPRLHLVASEPQQTV